MREREVGPWLEGGVIVGWGSDGRLGAAGWDAGQGGRLGAGAMTEGRVDWRGGGARGSGGCCAEGGGAAWCGGGGRRRLLGQWAGVSVGAAPPTAVT
ncbi:hypothetical protein KI387_018295, partial [Taxus chinensis]